MSQRVSLCLIVKNEEANLPACLGSAAGLAHEIIVVDTGSTDGTREVAARLGASVHDFPWVDDFAAARNESLRRAAGAWIFWLDADDRIDEDNLKRLRALFAGLKDENAAYLMACQSLGQASGALSYLDHARLFRNHPEIRWRYRVHEQILPAVEKLGGEVRSTDVVIQHVGYRDAGLLRAKHERNLRLLHLDREEHADDPHLLFYLGWTYHALQRPVEGMPYLRQCLERSAMSSILACKSYILLVMCHRQLGQVYEALTTCREGSARYPEDLDLLYQQAILSWRIGDFFSAERSLLQLLQLRPAGYVAIGGDREHYRSLARYNLAVLYRDQSRFAEAEAQWRAALAEQPGNVDTLLGLGELCLGQGRWPEVDDILRQLDAKPQATVESAVLRAQKLMAFQMNAAARELLEQTLTQAPQALGPRILYGRLLWQEGRDRQAIAAALQNVLALDPNNAEARANLQRLGS